MTDSRDDSSSPLDAISNTVIPMAIKDIRVGKRGLVLGNPRRNLALDFLYRGARFEASVDVSSAEPAALVRAVFGTLPYSAESPHGRRAALVAIKGGRWSRSSVGGDHLIRAETTVPIDPARLSPNAIVVALAEGVMRLKPLLEQLQSMIQPTLAGPIRPAPAG